jgi:AraC family transcriptional regulator, regulatory protein of adaptative response / DNA-3-methyladenine glycosylase II
VVGRAVDVGIPGIDRALPSAAELADDGWTLLRAPESRRQTLARTAAAIASGELDLAPIADRAMPAGLAEQLLAMRGIGPWTVGWLALFGYGDPDVLLTGDSAVRLGARRLGLEAVGPAELLAFAEPFRPWRSYLAMHLWVLAAPGGGASRPGADPAPTEP